MNLFILFLIAYIYSPLSAPHFWFANPISFQITLSTLRKIIFLSSGLLTCNRPSLSSNEKHCSLGPRSPRSLTHYDYKNEWAENKCKSCAGVSRHSMHWTLFARLHPAVSSTQERWRKRSPVTSRVCEPAARFHHRARIDWVKSSEQRANGRTNKRGNRWRRAHITGCTLPRLKTVMVLRVGLGAVLRGLRRPTSFHTSAVSLYKRWTPFR
jgi:hypothetical protein